MTRTCLYPCHRIHHGGVVAWWGCGGGAGARGARSGRRSKERVYCLLL